MGCALKPAFFEPCLVLKILHLVAFLDLFIVGLILNLELFEVNEVQTVR